MTTIAQIGVPMSEHGGGLFMGMHWLWWVAWLVTFLGIAWAAARLYRDRSESQRRRASEDAAEQVLRRKFAEGEIDEDELARRLRVLRETQGGS